MTGGCPITYSVNNSNAADFMFGQPNVHYFEFGFDADSLRTFVRLAQSALREMEALSEVNDNERAELGASA